MSRRVWLPLLVAVASGLVFLFARHYPWLLAILAGAGFGALTFTVLRAIDNLRGLSSPPEVDLSKPGWLCAVGQAGLSDAGGAGEDSQRNGEKQVDQPIQSDTGQQ